MYMSVLTNNMWESNNFYCLCWCMKSSHVRLLSYCIFLLEWLVNIAPPCVFLYQYRL